MEGFINREPELRLIDDALGDLINKERLLRTPIIDFYGVEGIGKTSILSEVAQKCTERLVPCIQADASHDQPEFAQHIIQQTARYHILPLPQPDDTDTFVQLVQSTKTLLEQGPLVMLLDAVDVTNEVQLEFIEKLLSALIVHNKFFVILTSRTNISFDHERSVARKLTSRPLQPFDREHSELYLEYTGYSFSSEVRDVIFEWTRGYPLAMDVMVHAITQQGIDPLLEQGKQDLIAIIVERVITASVLKNVKQQDMPWFHTILNLLAVPRRFNLVIMQELIERFESDLKLANSLAYMALPKRIAPTGVLGWNLAKAGYALDDPVRNILLLALKTRSPERYYAINRFLAKTNWRNAADVTGSDRIRYQREYLYHSAKARIQSNYRRSSMILFSRSSTMPKIHLISSYNLAKSSYKIPNSKKR